MESSNSPVIRFALCLLATAGMAVVLFGQEANPSPQSFSLVTDWSHRHLMYSAPNTARVREQFRQQPRYWQQWLRRNAMLQADGSAPPVQTITSSFQRRKRFKRDWAVSLGPGATVGAGQYPAKFAFNITTAQCGSAANPDFVVFNTSVTGSATQASVVAFDNLYSGCSGTKPSTYWAYNTGGAVVTSVVLSGDGTQLAFAQSVSSQAQLVLLKWQASTTATSTSPGTINSVSASQYSTCTAPCMTTIAFSGGANDTNSSPFYDYVNDAIYVGDDAGTLHKFTPIFHGGTPAEVMTGWPVTVASGLKLTSPVHDSQSGRVFVGSGYNVSGSQLFAVDGASGTVTATSSSLGKGVGVGIADGPIVDSSVGELYVFLGNDGGTGCSGPCSAVYQFPTNFTSGSGTKATVGESGSFALYIGDFDNAYFTSANGTGNLFVCGGGLASPEPTIYRVPITAGAMSTSSVGGPALSLSGVPCSPVTDVYNPAGSVDRIFAGVTNGSDAKACSSAGCIANLVTGVWKPSTSYTVGQTILDSANYWQVVATAGTSNSSAPSWIDTCSNKTTDGGVIWVNAGFLTPVTPQAWQASAYWSVGSRILDSNNNLECNLQTGEISGTTQPVWNTTIGGLTTEPSGLEWRNGGPQGSHALAASGGTSGIIMDNIVGSGALAGASEVYFSPLSSGGCGAGNGCAVQASQSGLN
jgi:hypothetical protein